MDWIKSSDKKPATEPQIIVSRKACVGELYWCESARLEADGRYTSDTDGQECHFAGTTPDTYTHWMPFVAPEN